VDKLIEDMSEEITYAPDDVIDKWHDDHFALARVHHGVVNPEPQPVFNEAGSLCAVMAGEVFDYDSEKRSLIEQGHRFRLQGNDGEYCLHLYEQYGTEAFAKLNGSFLLALYDRTTHELILVNDRFSSHFLFYYYDGQQLVFGTQLRPLLKFQSLPRRLDLQAVFEFFALQRLLGSRTYYRDVKMLPPASILRFRVGEISLCQYWTTEYKDELYPEAYYVEALADGLKRAVSRRTQGNHRFGLLLSGGLDSRTVVACCDRPLTAFTFGDFENQEVRIAQRIAEVAACQHVFLKRSFDHYPNLMEEAIDIGDGMQRFDHAHAPGLLKDIRSSCDILLDAFGFDARFKGLWLIHKTISAFGRRIRSPLLLEVSQLESLETWKRIGNFVLSRKPHELFNSPYKLAFNDTILSSIKDMLKEVTTRDPQNLIEYPMANSFRSIFGYLMVLAVRSYMGQRSIVFDNDLLEISLSIPPRLRARGRVLRKALKMLSPELAAIPNANTGLRADLPVWPEWLLVSGREALREIGVLRRPQLPHPAYTNRSWPNKAELIRHNDKIRRSIEETLHDPECIDPDLFNVEAVDSILEKHMNREEDYSRLLYLLLTFGRWHKKYGPK
jgi:asparagine synthase (glutamine-hydrolysing)